MNDWRHGLDLYRRLLAGQIRSQLQYRASFVLDCIAQAFATGLWFLSFALVLQRFGNLAGWKLADMALLSGVVHLSLSLMDLMVGGFDIDRFPQFIRRGTLDQILLRPLPIEIQIASSAFEFRRIGRVAQSGALVLYGLVHLPGVFTLSHSVLLAAMVVGTTAFLVAMTVLGSAIVFWTVDRFEGMNILCFGLAEMVSYPLSVYPEWARTAVIYVLPAGLLVYPGAVILTGRPDPLHLPVAAAWLSPIIGAAAMGIATLVWKSGLKRYQSTGS